MTDVHDMISAVRDTDAYRGFEDANDCYLAHVFANAKADEVVVEVGFYDPAEDRITVFTIDPVAKKPPEEAFKESGSIDRLAIDEVSVGLEDARRIARKHSEENYPGHPVAQEICILQQLDAQPVWNLTLVTHTLNMLNIHIHAADGSVMETDMQNILSLRK